MNVDINFVFTEAALEMRGTLSPTSWSAPDIGVTPIQGDLVSFGSNDDAAVFVVKNRLFIWKSPTHLVIQPLLDVLSPQP
jgi:hypothetical protein